MPSLAYQRERWDIGIEHEQGNVDLYRDFLKEMREHPGEQARESWNFAKERDPQSISGFSGPEDKAYHAALIKRYESSLTRVEQRLKELKAHRP